MSLKRVAVSLSFVSALAVPAIASAQEPKKDCEPGSWFCGETNNNPQPAAPANKGGLEPLPDANPATQPKPVEKAPPPPVVVYQPPPPTVVVQAREAPAPYYYVPKKAVPKKEWGLNLHVGGVMLGKGRDSNTDPGMGLAGLGLRFRPIPQAAIEGSLDFAAGRDYNGYRRNETAFSLNGLIFVNPKSVTQFYLLGGFGWSGAHATDDRDGYDRVEYTYGYFGVQAGMGLEFRVSRTVALNIDLRGLIRGRIDNDRRQNPEFTSGDGKTTNASGAGLLTGGLTFYW